MCVSVCVVSVCASATVQVGLGGIFFIHHTNDQTNLVFYFAVLVGIFPNGVNNQLITYLPCVDSDFDFYFFVS